MFTSTTAPSTANNVSSPVADSKSVHTKLDSSPVTVADFGGQAIVCSIVHDHFPNDSIVGEEDSSELRQNPDLLARVVSAVQEVSTEQKITSDFVTTAIDRGTGTGGPSGRFWTIDPVDGTLGFLRGPKDGQYACALALIVDGRVKLGVLGCPNLMIDPSNPSAGTGVMFVGVENQPAVMIPLQEKDIKSGTAMETPVHASATSNSTNATFVESVDGSHSSHSTAARIGAELGITNAAKRMDSQVKYGVLARGDADIYLRFAKK
jgi:3'(2'), 5'-bisphosphate nucleotidase